jgi:hypothetical protein
VKKNFVRTFFAVTNLRYTPFSPSLFSPIHAFFAVPIIMSTPFSRPAAAPATEALIKQVIDENFGGPAACTLPEDKEVFSHHEAAFERVQRYAFANGFAVVESQVDKRAHRRVFSCVHYGKPANKRKLTGDAVRKEIFEQMDGKDEKGRGLRQRQGFVCVLSCRADFPGDRQAGRLTSWPAWQSAGQFSRLASQPA